MKELGVLLVFSYCKASSKFLNEFYFTSILVFSGEIINSLLSYMHGAKLSQSCFKKQSVWGKRKGAAFISIKSQKYGKLTLLCSIGSSHARGKRAPERKVTIC